MDLHISKNSEQFIRSQVKSGRYTSENEVVEEALRLLKQRDQAPITGESLSEEEFQRQLLEIGLMSHLPESAADRDDPDDQPVVIEGEPLSETVIRERR